VRALLFLLLLTAPALAAETRVQGTVTNPSESAHYTVWVVTDLDLTAPGQPAATVPVDPTTHAFDGTVRFDGPLPPHWIFLHQRFQSHGGPPVDLFMPVDLLPRTVADGGPVSIKGVSPELLMDRRKVAPSALPKTLFVALIVVGLGVGIRRRLQPFAAPMGRRSAPLIESPPPPPVARWEWGALTTALLVAAGLRLQQFSSASLDLLETTYLPSIGRPDPVGAASGLGAIPRMLQELGALYSLDVTHPPGYHAVVGAMGLLGDNPGLLRAPALLASLTTAGGLWWLLRRWSVGGALLALAAFAACQPAIYFGQDATPYAGVGLVAIASTLLAERALRTGRTGPWIGFFAVLVTGFFFHYNVAPMGIAQIGLLAALAWAGRDDRRWPAALHRAAGPALALSPLPLLWLWPHFTTFEPVAQNTRLVADTYAPDPGALSFLWDFYSVTAGLTANTPAWAAAATVPLLGLGLHRAIRSEDAAARAVGWLMLAMSAAFFFSIFFFYVNVRDHLGGKVFYGFRWVGWYLPVMLGATALGAVRGAGPWPLRAALAGAWLAGLLPGTWQAVTEPARPDYEGVASFIESELQPRDGLASLPTWFQRGNISFYFFQHAVIGRLPQEGEGMWMVDGVKATFEAVHPMLPFESSAPNAHVDRLWVANVDEQMSGRSKFNPVVAANAFAWADEHLEPDGVWAFDRIELRRYRRPAAMLTLGTGDELLLSADETVLNFRTYPLVDASRPGWRVGAELTPLDHLGPTVRYQAPTSPGCVDWTLRGLPDALDPDAANHWYLELRIPLAPGVEPQVEPLGPAQIQQRREGDVLRITAVGRPCWEEPLRIRVTGT